MWLAWWIVQDDSHSALRANADSNSRRAGSIGIGLLPADVWCFPILPRGQVPNFSISRDIPANLGIKSHDLSRNREFIPMSALDAIDRKILSLLQSDSRMTMQELADKVGLSVSPCHRRVKLLEQRGVITRYVATVDQKTLGLHVSVFISIKLARQKEEDLNLFAK